MPAAASIGALPVALSYLLRVPGHQVATALLLWPLFLAFALRGSWLKGVGTVALAFGAHSALVIAFASLDPARTSDVVAGGSQYWQKQLHWITTGQDPEYALANWVPAHGQLLVAVLLLSLTSLGLLVFYHGLFEVDLMNFYCGQLLAHSKDAAVAVGFGWHLWSVCRGVGFMLITYEVASWALERLGAAPSPARGARVARWSAGLGFVLADAALKYFLLEPVRLHLAANLR